MTLRLFKSFVKVRYLGLRDAGSSSDKNIKHCFVDYQSRYMFFAENELKHVFPNAANYTRFKKRIKK